MKYIMIPMLEDLQAGPSVELSHNEMLEYVYKYNRGALGHSDAWFELSRVSNTGVTEQLEVSDFYEEATKYMSSK